jgi:hypothetical protein
MKDASPNTDQARLYPSQKLVETWTVEITRPRYGALIEARLKDWPCVTHYLSAGQGGTVREARFDLVVRIAKAILEDATTDRERDEGLALAAQAAEAGLASRDSQAPNGDPS